MRLYNSPEGDSGIWFSLHTLAMHADAQDQAAKATYASQMKYLALRLYCKECSTHFQEFLMENPLPAYFRTEGGIFLWSWHFHNSVNVRLGKPVMSLEEARALYSPATAHSCIDCGSGSAAPPVKTSAQSKTTRRVANEATIIRPTSRFTRVNRRRR